MCIVVQCFFVYASSCYMLFIKRLLMIVLRLQPLVFAVLVCLWVQYGPILFVQAAMKYAKEVFGDASGTIAAAKFSKSGSASPSTTSGIKICLFFGNVEI